MSTYEKYLAMVVGVRVLYPQQRAGQAHWNVLVEEFPTAAGRVTVDPFYSDEMLPAFLAEVESLLATEDA